jgi:hypothetical protein
MGGTRDINGGGYSSHKMLIGRAAASFSLHAADVAYEDEDSLRLEKGI